MNSDDEILLTSYVLGEATPAERARCEERLARDAEFRAAAADLRRVVGLTTDVAREELVAHDAASAPADLRAEAAATDGAAEHAAGAPTPQGAPRRRTWFRAAAAAALLIVAGETYRRRDDAGPSSTREAIRTAPLLVAKAEETRTALGASTGDPAASLSDAAAPATNKEEPPLDTELRLLAAEAEHAGAAPAAPDLTELLVRAAAGEVGREPTALNTPAAKNGERRKLRGELKQLAEQDVPRDALHDREELLKLYLQDERASGEDYAATPENPFLRPVGLQALSTFAADVDTASYANVRRIIDGGALPPPAAVRVEEFVNAFRYRDARPDAERPLALHASTGECPWRPRHRLLRVTLKARELDFARRPRMNLVFLLDVSGSMDDPRKLPLVVRSMRTLADQLGENDKLSIVVYAGASGVALPPTNGDRRVEIREALERLKAGGSTNGGEGIRLAYRLARENFLPGAVNRVVLCTDGDFNVGTTAREDLEALITTEARGGVFLTALGFGYGNLKDATLEMLANKGDGNYGYVSDDREARKLLVEGFAGTLVAVAKDVKLQVEFNPATVLAYRLLGYENRRLNAEDFRDDAKDAGEIGAGHVVTALYEIVPNEAGLEVPGAVGPLKYQPTPAAELPSAPQAQVAADEWCTARVRYLPPEGGAATELAAPIKVGAKAAGLAAEELRFAGAVALFGLKLRRSPSVAEVSWPFLIELAAEATGTAADVATRDPHGERAELLSLVRRAAALDLGRR